MTPPAPQDRSFGDVVGDTAKSAVRGALGVPRGLVGLGQLVPGLNEIADPAARWLDEQSTAIAGTMSPQAQANMAAMHKAMQEGRWLDAGGEALAPSNMVDLAANAIGSLGGMRLLGGIAGRVAPQAFGGLTTPMKAGLLEGAYTTGAMAGQFGPQDEYSLERLAAIPAGAITGAIGGGMAARFPDVDVLAVLGRRALAEQGLQQSKGPLLQRMLSSAVRESGEEFIQSGQEAAWPQMVNEGTLNINQMLAEGMVGAVPGALMGGAMAPFQPAPLSPPPAGFTGPPAPTAAILTTPPTPATGYPVDPYAQQRQEQINRMMLNDGQMNQPVDVPGMEQPGFIPGNDRIYQLQENISNAKNSIAQLRQSLEQNYPVWAALPDGAQRYRAALDTLTSQLYRDQAEYIALTSRGPANATDTTVAPPAADQPAAPAAAPAAVAPAATGTDAAPASAVPDAAADVKTLDAARMFEKAPGSIANEKGPQTVALFDKDGNPLGSRQFAPGELKTLIKARKWKARAAAAPVAPEAAPVAPEAAPVAPEVPPAAAGAPAAAPGPVTLETAQQAASTAQTVDDWQSVTGMANELLASFPAKGRPTASKKATQALLNKARDEIARLNTPTNPPQPESQEATPVIEQGQPVAETPPLSPPSSQVSAEDANPPATAAKTTSRSRKVDSLEVEKAAKRVTELEQDGYVNELSKVIDDPTYQVVPELQPAKQAYNTISQSISELDDIRHKFSLSEDLIVDDAGNLKRKTSLTKAETAQPVLNELARRYTTLLNTLKEQFSVFDKAVRNGVEDVDNAQSLSKLRATSNSVYQSSIASLFSQYYAAYKNKSLNPENVATTIWRPEDAKKNYSFEKGSLEDQGVPTAETQFGRIATGGTLPAPKENKDGTPGKDRKQTILKQAIAAADTEEFVSEASRNADIAQRAALSFVLHHIAAKERSPLTLTIAQSVLNLLNKGGGLYHTKLAYYPMQASAQKNKLSTASYDPVTNTINVYGPHVRLSDVLHEALHAATAAFIANNPKAKSVQALDGLARDLWAFVNTRGNEAYKAALPKNFLEVMETAHVEDADKKNIARMAAELVSHALTHQPTISAMKRGTMSKTTSGLVDSVVAGLKSAAKTLYTGFTNIVRAIFGIENTTTNTQFAGFLSAYEALMTDIQTAALGSDATKSGKQAFRTGKLGVAPLYSEAGDTIEQELREQQREAARELRRKRQDAARARAAADQPLGATQSQRALTAAASAVDIVGALDSLRQRGVAYKHIDALGKMLLGFIPNKLLPAERRGKLTDRLHKLAVDNPALGRLAINLIDNFMLPLGVQDNMFNKSTRVRYVDDIANSIAQDEQLSFAEQLQEQGLAYLKDSTQVPSDWRIKKLIDVFNETIEEARAYGLIPQELSKAKNEELFAWLSDKHYPYTQGYKYGQSGKNLISTRNGYEEQILSDFVPGVGNDENPVLTMWIRKDSKTGDEPRYDTFFVSANLSPEAQRQHVESAVGKGYEPTSHRWYQIRKDTAFRFKTPTEQKAEAGSTMFLRSIAATMQEFEHNLAGIKF
jgi:hypothetical protein